MEAFRLVLFVLLLLLSAYFSSAETALFSLRKSQLLRLPAGSSHIKATILKLIEQPRSLLTTILLGNTVVNLLLSVIAAGFFTERFGAVQGPWLATGAVTLVLLVFGEIAPKTIAVGAPLRVSRWVAPGLTSFSTLLRPFTDVAVRVSDALTRRLDRSALRPPEVLTEEEIKVLVTMGFEEGVLHSREKEFIHNVFALHDRRVQDLMTSRVRVFALDVDSDIETIRDAVALAGFTRIPLYEGRLDHIVGYLEATDLLWGSEQPDTRTVRQLLHPMVFVPQTKHAGELLQEMHRDALPIAGVVDEHGSFAGVVSLEDAVEQVVGEIQDLHDKERFHVTRTPEGDVVVAAHMELKVFNSLLQQTLHDDQAETIGGFVLNRLGQVPHAGAWVEDQGVRLIVEAAQPNRILKLRVQKKHLPGGAA